VIKLKGLHRKHIKVSLSSQENFTTQWKYTRSQLKLPFYVLWDQTKTLPELNEISPTSKFITKLHALCVREKNAITNHPAIRRRSS
jgi:hypothetical protein